MALYGNTILENPLEFDEIYTKMRVIIIDFLLNTGYTEEQLLENDISKEFFKELQKQQPWQRKTPMMQGASLSWKVWRRFVSVRE